MLSKLLLTLTFVLLILTWLMSGAPSPDEGVLVGRQRQYNELRLQRIELRQQIVETRNSIIACESGWRHDGVWGDHGRAYGIAQFHETTFYELAKKYGYVGGHWQNLQDQITVLDLAILNGDAEKHWACWPNKK